MASVSCFTLAVLVVMAIGTDRFTRWSDCLGTCQWAAWSHATNGRTLNVHSNVNTFAGGATVDVDDPEHKGHGRQPRAGRFAECLRCEVDSRNSFSTSML